MEEKTEKTEDELREELLLTPSTPQVQSATVHPVESSTSTVPNPIPNWTPSNTKSDAIDLENWMAALPPHLTEAPVIYLAIPGSHNSFSYSISPNSEVSPDSPSFVQGLGKWCKPFANRIIYNWSKGQQEDVLNQLRLGIRYFDVRLVVHKKEIVISHGLYGGLIQKFLEEINGFLERHEKEFVILDFQHFYEFKDQDHSAMIAMLFRVFGNKICRRQRRMRENTLSILRGLKNQILLIYRDEVARFHDILWTSGTWPTPWPNTDNVDQLLQSLKKGLIDRKSGRGYVTQGILTPTTKYICLHMFGSLKKCAAKANRSIISWVQGQNNGVHGINVVICDFIENYEFCETVIRLNYKGFENYEEHFRTSDD